MAAHEAPAAVHDHIAADYTRRRAPELREELRLLFEGNGPVDVYDLIHWAGQADMFLAEVIRG